MRVIYLYLTTAAAVEEGTSMQPYAFLVLFFFFNSLQQSPSGNSKNGREHMLLYSHILTQKTPESITL